MLLRLYVPEGPAIRVGSPAPPCFRKEDQVTDPKGVSIRLEGSEETLSRLNEAAERFDHPAPLFDAIGAMLVTSTQTRFEKGATPDGNPWPPSLRALATGGKTLIDSARLFGSMTHEASDSGVAVGTNAIYAAIHQFGGTIRPKNAEALAFQVGGQSVFAQSVTLPARPFLGLDDEDRSAIEESVRKYLLEAVEG
jgi:phage virion morphogenesis protein